MTIGERTRRVLEELQNVYSDLLAISDDIWLSIDHNDPQARRDGNVTAAAQANTLIQELEYFARRMRQVEEKGFACAALDKFVADEALDRWSGDGIFSPASHAALLAQEEAWQVDINYGVRVNIAPIQQAALLAGDVLAKKDVDKAIADRARWRRRATLGAPG
ncbi:MAG: hypothetical protein KF893_01575 [Caldilineaceae bacterium]|nr:hypothetical protein [Caldilineaceae bacterium]